MVCVILRKFELCNVINLANALLVSTESADEAHHFDAEHFVHALFDSVCTFVQHAPLLPVEKELHEQMEERVRSVNTIPTKLTAFDEKIPLSK
uniref:Uncharacterized protein n=1 Tax=Wuchereria bancrofti TaxID=6293 RepID=A0A1I8EIT4_WUCBA